MKTLFTLAQLEAFATSRTRFTEFREVLRSYNGISIWDSISDEKLVGYVDQCIRMFPDMYGAQDASFTFRGKAFEIRLFRKDLEVRQAHLALDISIQGVKTGRVSLKEAYAAAKRFKNSLDCVEI